MDATDSNPELKGKPIERERSASDMDSSQLEGFDTVPEEEDSLSNQLDSLPSLDNSLLERNDSSMDQDESPSKIDLDEQDGELVESSTKNNSKCAAMHEESTSLDEVSGRITKNDYLFIINIL